MNVAFLLHLYQPPTQSDSVLRQVCTECYLPLIKLIKTSPGYKFTLNIPLSLLERLEAVGYTELIKDIKELYDAERIELVGCAAYHALLTKVRSELVEEEIILNEYGLGYYAGSHHGFEGEDSILLKNLRGFFPPELSINDTVYEKVNELGYEWILADHCAVPQEDTLFLGQNIFKYKNYSTLLVIRDCVVSNMLSFKRDALPDEIISYINKKSETADSIVIALDGEAFGHHNKDGIFLLDALCDYLTHNSKHLVTVSEVVAETLRDKTDTIYESNWSETVCVNDPKKIYKLWDDPHNKVQQLLWKMQRAVIEKYSHVHKQTAIDGFETIAPWKSSDLANLTQEQKGELELALLLHKSLHSDQFWWASGEVLDSKVLFSPKIIERAVDYYKELSARMSDPDLITLVDKDSTELMQLMADREQ